MGTGPVGFTGGSLFASDLQQVITRAVNIASLPIQQLTNEKSKLSDQSTALSQLSDQFTKLQASITRLGVFGWNFRFIAKNDSTKSSEIFFIELSMVLFLSTGIKIFVLLK